jgi:hypothetical protein
MPLFIRFSIHILFTTDDGMEHITHTIFLFGVLLGGCGPDIDLELVCRIEEFMLVLKVSIGSVQFFENGKRQCGFHIHNPNLLPNNPVRQ